MITIHRTINKKALYPLIDIHTHLIYNVDDGAINLDMSKRMLAQAKDSGVCSIIATPHITYGADLDKEKRVNENFAVLKKHAAKLGITLMLGNEILVNSDTDTLLKNKSVRSLAGTNYALVEFKRHDKNQEEDCIRLLEDIMDMGYQVILAHPELYSNHRKISFIEKLRNSGVLIQIDAASIVNKVTRNHIYRFTKKLLQLHYVDFVASDAHNMDRRSYKLLKDAYLYCNKKYDDAYVKKIFCENAQMMIEGVL